MMAIKALIMQLKSMTGFARRDGNFGDTTWYWELRGVNARGFDLRLRLPSPHEVLERSVREAISSRVVRGNITASLTYRKSIQQAAVTLNEGVLDQVLSAATRIRERTGDQSALAVGAILGVKGVLELSEKEETSADLGLLREAILADLMAAVSDFDEARRAEGRHLGEAVMAQVLEMEQLVGQVETVPARTAHVIFERLCEQVDRLSEGRHALDSDRLHQETALLATKADITEELDRIRAHIFSARHLLESNGPVGRKLEFLAQEFHREANTLCSKSNHIDVTRCGLALKAVIDQMREQVQNIE
ncbi:MAG: YicC/YloC family endoribonuclease [Hyphomicrobiaceae bacterium]